MDIQTIRKAVWQWIVDFGGLPEGKVIFANQGEQRPKRPYAVVNFVNPGVRLGAIDPLRFDQDQDKFILSGLRSSLISINIIGDGANDRMSKLLNTLDNPDVIDRFYAAGFSVMGEVGPTDLTEYLETKYEERSQLDLEINYAHDTATEVERIEEVEPVEAEIELGIEN